MKIGIIDYGMGNIKSITNSLNYISIKSSLISDSNEIKNYDTIILPGVGAFEKAIKNLKNKNFVEPILNHAKAGKKIIGICLGMQILFEESFEFGNHFGLGLIKGKVLPFEKKINQRIPHVGWNEVISKNNEYNSFSGDYYFVHSYYCNPKFNSVILFKTNYEIPFCSGVKKDNIYGLQFHPEKSHMLGLNLLKKIINE